METLKVTCLGRNGSYSVPRYPFSNVNIMDLVELVSAVASGFYYQFGIFPKPPSLTFRGEFPEIYWKFSGAFQPYVHVT